MAKRIIISDKFARSEFLRENILRDSLPNDIVSAIIDGKTSLGHNNPSIPEVYDTPYLKRILDNEFKDICKKVKSLDTINIPENDITSGLSHLIRICQKKEYPIREQLEKVCVDKLIELFHIPKDTVEIHAELVDNVDLKDSSISIEPTTGNNNDFLFNDFDEANSLKDEIYKRRFLDMLCMGAGIRISSDIKSYIQEIYELDPSLPTLYRQILLLNTYLLFTKGNIEISDKNKKEMGEVSVSLGDGSKAVRILAQGKIFPVLYSELIQGFMELFASHGLPNNIKQAQLIVDKSDYLKAEPWDMRIGPSLWDKLSDAFSNENVDEMPYIFQRIARLKPNKFSYLMKEVLLGTRKSQILMNKIISYAKEDMKGDSGEDTEEINNKTIISDDKISD